MAFMLLRNAPTWPTHPNNTHRISPLQEKVRNLNKRMVLVLLLCNIITQPYTHPNNTYHLFHFKKKPGI